MARQRATRALVCAESTTQSAPENRQIAEGAFLSGTEPKLGRQCWRDRGIDRPK
jgi:hypothetical protein